jgi:adenylate cyclase
MITNNNGTIFKFSRQLPQVWRGWIWLLNWSAINLKSGVKLALVGLSVIGLVGGIRYTGSLQSQELAAYDRLVRLRPDAGIDPRLLVVAIDEADIEAQQQWPISDGILAQAIEKLNQFEPAVIGLDILRNVPTQPGRDSLLQQLQKPNVVVITYLGATKKESVSPPPGVPKQRVGFNNIVIDPDGIVRRNLLFASDGKSTFRSFSLQLALNYLNSKNITGQTISPQHYQIGKAIFTKLHPNFGGYQNIDARGYQVLLNYRSRQQVARQVTLTEVLNGQIDPNWVKDKIVLIGVNAPSVKDLYYTPYSAGEPNKRTMSGVILHAQMVSQILSAALQERPLFWEWSEPAEILWIGVWAFAGGLLAWKVHNPLILALSSLGVMGSLYGAAVLLFWQGGWVPLAGPALAAILTGSVVIAYQLKQAIWQHQMVMKLLGQQTSPEIADALWKSRYHLLNAGLLPGQRLVATMLMTDIRGFSTLSEQRSPEVVMAWLNEFLSVMAEQVQQHQGIINKFTGDGLLAVFGVPMPRTTDLEIAEDAQQAVACALEMGESLAQLNQGWRMRGLPTVEMRVGIYTGPVMVGSLGGKNRLEYGVIGDSVNIAARLESCEKHRQPSQCRILIATETLVRLNNRFDVESWGFMPLRGRQKPIHVYRVLGDRRQIDHPLQD